MLAQTLPLTESRCYFLIPFPPQTIEYKLKTKRPETPCFQGFPVSKCAKFFIQTRK